MTLTRPLFSISNILGIHNLPDAARIEPRGASSYLFAGVNIDIDNQGMPHRRKGYLPASYSGSRIHSLFGNKVDTLFVEGPDLKRLDTDTFTASTVRAGVGEARMVYVDAAGRIFYTNNQVIGYVQAGAGYTFSTPTATYKIPMPPGHLIDWFNGRLYVARKGEIWFSDAMYPGQTDSRRGFKQIGGYLTLMRAVRDGMYVSDGKAVYFMGGLSPKEFILVKVDEHPAIPGTDYVTDGENIGDGSLTGKVVVWLSPMGICAGGSGGTVRNLTSEHYHPRLSGQGHALVRINPRGYHEYLVALDDVQGTGTLSMALPGVRIAAGGSAV
jgi:hypothetical protein